MGLSRVPSEPALPTCLGSLAVDEAPSVTALIQHTPKPGESTAWFWRQAAQDAERRWLKCRHAEELGVRLHADLKRELHHVQQQAAEASSTCDSLRVELSEGGARYADLLHLVSQVDEEIATRRAAEERAAIAENNEFQTAQRCEAAEAQVAELLPRLADLEALFCDSQKECTERREAQATLNQRLGEILPEHAKLGLDLKSAGERIELLEHCLRSSEAQVQSLQEERQRLEGAHSDLQAAFQEEQRLRSSAEQQLKAALEEGQSLREQLNEKGQQVGFLQTEVDTLQENVRRLEEELQVSEAERSKWESCAAVALKELREGDTKAVSTFFCKFPASAALVMVFRRLVELRCPEETLQEALQCRMNLHRPTHLSRHELEYFLVECLGIDTSEVYTVGQVLFGILDLERQGVLNTVQLYERLVDPPTMREVWRANLEEIWPERHAAVKEMDMGICSPKRGGSPRRGGSPGRTGSPAHKRGTPANKSATPNTLASTATPRSSAPSSPVRTFSRSSPSPLRESTPAVQTLPPVSDRPKAGAASQPCRPQVPRPNSVATATSAQTRAQPRESAAQSARPSTTGKVSSTSVSNRCQSSLT